jgi:hypothetical protein
VAHQIVNSNEVDVDLTDPVTVAFDCGANATVLVLSVSHNATTARAGGLPSYGAQTFTDSGQGSVSQGGGETSCEMFYLTETHYPRYLLHLQEEQVRLIRL